MILTPITYKDRIICAHRGNPGNPPNSRSIENTIDSFVSAWQVGANAIEFDVQLSKDGILFIHHDDTFGRVFLSPDGNNRKYVSDYYWDDICKAKPNKELKNAQGHEPYTERDRIPRIEEVPVNADGKLFLELKVPKDRESQRREDVNYLRDLVERAADFIQRNRFFDRTYVLSFVPQALNWIKKCDDRIITALNIRKNELKRSRAIKHISDMKEQYGLSIVNPPFRQTTEDGIKMLHDLGLGTYPWVGKENQKKELKEIKRLLEQGADGVIINQPGKARDIRDGVTVPTVT